MLYAPAVCENCSAVFASTELIAEKDGEFSSYRRWAGPCPRCGGRGVIPEWVFRFHAIATIAMKAATPEQLHSLIQTLREPVNPALPGTPSIAIVHLTNELTGPWGGVVLELRRLSPADQRTAKLTFLLWIIDRSCRGGLADAANPLDIWRAS